MNICRLRHAAGYVALALKPVSGSVIKIELVEVANQANADTGANRTSRSVLAIVEAEFHEAVRQAERLATTFIFKIANHVS
jgi:hypothetical protein